MDASVASPVHTTKDAHYKGYTTLLPNICIYDMNASTNKCTSGYRGDQKQLTSVHSLLLSRQKGGDKQKSAKEA